jgi:threonine dehydratase
MLSPDAITEAATRIRPHVRRTPLIDSPWGRLKLETQQPTGSFKVRPAYNGMLAHATDARARGVLTSSSGNFAQAVALAARTLGIDALVVMTAGTSAYKIDRTRALGARIELCGDSFEERWTTTHRLARETGRLLLHPYDSEETIAGNGTIGLELDEDLDRALATGTVVVPVSGGGLVAGIALALAASRPGWRIVGAQPAANGSMARSLREGAPVTVPPFQTVADALVARRPGDRTFEIARAHVAEVVTVTEEELLAATAALAVETKLIVEPGGAAAVAALRAGKVREPGGPRATVAVVCGSNVPLAKLAAWAGVATT